MKKWLHISVMNALLLASLPLFPQEDTAAVLRLDSFLQQVKSQHPLSAIAELQMSRAEAQLLRDRSGFDPRLSGDYRSKDYLKTDYYQLAGAELNLPTWFGLEAKAGYEWNDGVYLNPENNVPQNGLWYAGLSLPLGRGLFIDERRAALKNARLQVEYSTASRQRLLNELMLEASLMYWRWYESWNVLQITREGLQLAEERFRAVKSNYQLGDIAAVDTLEASIQVQNRLLYYTKAQAEWTKAYQDLLLYLPATPADTFNMRPPAVDQLPGPVDQRLAMDSLRILLLEANPELREYHYKLEQLEVKERLKKEYLKPELNVNYNALSSMDSFTPEQAFSSNGYKWGVNFQMPLLLRKERGELQEVKVDIMETELNRDFKEQQLWNKLQALRAQLEIVQQQLDVASRNVRDYQRLLEAERSKFQIGESSLFLVNSREVNYLNARIKQMEISAGIGRIKALYLQTLGTD